MAADQVEPNGSSAAMVSLPKGRAKPIRELIIRLALATLMLAISTAFVWFDRDAYVDNVHNDGISFIDALYYSTVTMTTTGYGDITPLLPHARLLNAIVITPMRVGFLVLLVGTTVQVLANQGTRALRDFEWRNRMQDHAVIIGYGTTGRSAANTLRLQGMSADKIVIIDDRRVNLDDANYDGYAGFQGDATRSDLLRRAEVHRANQVIICLDRDDTAVLATLTVRQLNPKAHVIVSVREHENVSLARHSGADSVVTSAATVGRLMGLSATGPQLSEVIQDLLTTGTGLEICQRLADPTEIGLHPHDIATEQVLSVIRDGQILRFFSDDLDMIKEGDQLVVVRRASATSPDDSHVQV
ncbi:MAG: potassium transporter Kef [Arachnia propionica]|nr:MAG: potassium transporter Kef [Arachnia propionica]